MPPKSSKVVMPRAPISTERDRLVTFRVSDVDMKKIHRVMKDRDLNMTALFRDLINREDERIALKRVALRANSTVSHGQ